MTEKAKPVEREEYSAKQIATRIGTDSKTLRKFFRSTASTVKPVGQGGRYNFDAAELPKIQAEFEKWNTNKKPRGAGFKRGSTKPAVDIIEESEETLDFDELEPAEDELDEFDLEELEDDDIEEEDDDIELDIEED